jgi:hypothetical protein
MKIKLTKNLISYLKLGYLYGYKILVNNKTIKCKSDLTFIEINFNVDLPGDGEFVFDYYDIEDPESITLEEKDSKHFILHYDGFLYKVPMIDKEEFDIKPTIDSESSDFISSVVSLELFIKTVDSIDSDTISISNNSKSTLIINGDTSYKISVLKPIVSYGFEKINFVTVDKKLLLNICNTLMDITNIIKISYIGDSDLSMLYISARTTLADICIYIATIEN